MKQIDIINAYKTLEGLSNIKGFTSKNQWALYTLRKELRSYVDFYEERAKAIMEKYAEFADDQGIIRDQPYIDYMKERSELDNMKINEEIHKIELPVVDGISFLTIESLENFIIFTAE